MTVYVLEHDDRMYEMGDKYIRGVYATREAAEADVKAKAVRRGLHQNDDHDASCCSVEEWDVRAEPLPGTEVPRP